MFSLFQKKQITVEVASYEESRFVAGAQMVTEKKTYKSDVQKLQKRFYGLRDKLEDRSNPSGTMVIFHNPDQQGRFSYFVGDLVDRSGQGKEFTVLELEPGEYLIHCWSYHVQGAQRPRPVCGQGKVLFYGDLAPLVRIRAEGQRGVHGAL